MGPTQKPQSSFFFLARRCRSRSKRVRKVRPSARRISLTHIALAARRQTGKLASSSSGMDASSLITSSRVQKSIINRRVTAGQGSDDCSRFGAKRSKAERSGAKRSEAEIATNQLSPIGFCVGRQQRDWCTGALAHPIAFRPVRGEWAGQVEG